MEGHGEAAADVITGGVIARAVEPAAGEAQKHESHGNCLNCGAVLTGPYCSNCGQTAHPHRSLVALGHDILHGVFHFEGKVWNTIPELFLRPGRLTRRYIDGERAKFVSPMALYLFSVFLMFAVFPFTEDSLSVPDDPLGVREQYQENIAANIEELDDKIEAQQEKLEAENLSAAERAEILTTLNEAMSAREVMQTMLGGDLSKLAALPQRQIELAQALAAANGAPIDPRAAKPEADEQAADDRSASVPATVAKNTNGLKRIEEAVKKAGDNPALLAYKLKTAGYKYSWALIPLSMPFMWLLFFWRRDVHIYDHAIFVTYSISFMMLLVVLLSVADTLGVSAFLWGTALAVIPPLHLYKQLRGAYGLSRFGAWVRLFLLSIMVIFVLTLFAVMLLIMTGSG
ncbi:MAG TPA: DUF3667 domain-containing protein [Steroidobacter sp.]|uniref:DUF3667 domain-containing protein n=1 Tax=Steroidobacter sp. TaxID=1978227 RepID=UPI002ED9F76A